MFVEGMATFSNNYWTCFTPFSYTILANIPYNLLCKLRKSHYNSYNTILQLDAIPAT
eukprot:gnl/Chilomastix_caulleri/5741.p2 GENE.gnl/Chilomastix_caulleri/5741~~gnl/Chilomastix_caulleri/5741.p2  ORF type:complete len:57 (-),score=2.01 gnl/Chilomastix_caulleri/5741:138-308(-)